MSLYNLLHENVKNQKHILNIRVCFQNDRENLPKNFDTSQQSLADHIKIHGYHDNHPIPYSAVLYINNNTVSIFKTDPGDAIISFGFSGCRLIKFTIGHATYAAHVPPASDAYWQMFRDTFQCDVIKEYTPTPDNDKNVKQRYPAYRCWGIIEDDNTAYSLTVYEDIEYEYNPGSGLFEYEMPHDGCTCLLI